MSELDVQNEVIERKILSLSKATILGADDLTVEEVNCPECGGTVFVRTLTGVERDEIEAHMFQTKSKDSRINMTNLRARMVGLCLVDENGKRIFKGKEFEKDIEALGRKSSLVLDRVFTVAQKLAGMRKEDVEELTKNSEEGQDEDSSSD
jgi:hypothetical protein